jgi:hypothetical protein
MTVVSEVLISFFDSKEAALRAFALVESSGYGRSAVVLTREPDGSRSRYEPPAQLPLGAVAGLCLGAIVGSRAGETGLVVGFFFGLYLGLFIDAWRRFGRGDLLFEIQGGLSAGQAAVVSFVPGWSAASIEKRLAPIGAVTVHRFPGVPVEKDIAREIAQAQREVDRLALAGEEPSLGDKSERARRLAAVRRLNACKAIAARLLGQERAQFEFDVDILRRQLDGASSLRAMRIERRISQVEMSYAHLQNTLDTSRGRVHTAAALVG